MRRGGGQSFRRFINGCSNRRMRLFLLILIAAVVSACQTKGKEAEYNHVIKAADLVMLVEEGRLSDLTQFLETAGFRIIFTNTTNDGRHVSYRCKDSSGRNTISINVEDSSLVRSLNFSTEDKRLFDKIDQDLRKNGFYDNNNLFDDPKLIKKGSLIEITEWIGEGGGRVDYQVVINKRE